MTQYSFEQACLSCGKIGRPASTKDEIDYCACGGRVAYIPTRKDDSKPGCPICSVFPMSMCPFCGKGK